MSRKKRVDAIDIQILNILQKDGRIASKELANQIGLSEGPTSKRLKNLLKRGIVEKVIATINQNAFGYNYQVLMLFKLVEGKAPWFISKMEERKNIDDLKEASDQCKQLGGFLGRALPEYRKIQKFLELNTDNLSSLDTENRDKIEWLKSFFNKEDPTADFRTARKTFSELNGAINQLLKSLHEDAVKTYNEVFDSLEAEANKKDVPLSAFSTRSHKLERLKRLNSISSLRLAIKDAGSFKSQQLDSILKETNRQQGNDKAEEPPVHYKPGGNNKFSIISNQQELDEYLTEVRNEMERILKENKKIILE